MNKCGIALFFLSVALLVGCNGSSSSSDSGSSSSDSGSTIPTTYTFIDEPVKGLYYESETQSGCTDAAGHFEAMPDERVEFYIGKCDDNNAPTLTDQAIKIGTVAMPSSITTPYHLQVSSTHTVSVNPIAVATILKSLNRSSNSDRLDLTGLLFKNKGVDLRKTLQDLIESPSLDASTVLNTALYNNIVLANSDSNLNFVHSDFLDENTVKSELSSTLGELTKSDIFTAEYVAGKTVVTQGGDKIVFAKDFTENVQNAYFWITGHSNTNGYNGDWGIYGAYDSNQFGKLAIDVGQSSPIQVAPIAITDSYWIVSVDDGSHQLWTVRDN